MPEPSAKTREIKAIAAVGRWLGVSRYDRTSSMLLALLCTIGATAVLLFVLWLTGKIAPARREAVGPTLTSLAREGEEGGNRQAPGGSQLDDPASTEPVVGKDQKTSDVQENLSTLDVNAVTKRGDLDDLDALERTRHGSIGTGDGVNGGNGPGRGEGIGDRPPGERKKPEAVRNWQVTFSNATLDAYAAQLDFFKIELAVLLPDNKVAYAFNLAKPKPDTRITGTADEKRFYLTWRKGEMEKADRELLARAGIERGDRIVVKFLSAEVENTLLDLERRSAADAGFAPKDVRMTRFGIRPQQSGFSFYVLEQSYRR
jgi:hypothetical protein